MASFIRLLITIVLLAKISSISECATFITQPSDVIKIARGNTAFLQWIYKLESGEVLVKKECFFQNTHSGTPVRIASGKTLKSSPKFPNLKSYDLNNSIAMFNLDYQDTGVYSFIISTVFNSKPAKLSSKKALLKVEGKPLFCKGHQNRLVKVKEHESHQVKVTVCGLPVPTLTYKWDIGEPIKAKVLKVNDNYSRFIATFTLNSLARDRCGRNVTYYARNSFGNSKEQQINVQVLFKPAKPRILQLSYVNNGRGVEVKWEKQESGLCDIKYQIVFFNLKKEVLQKRSGININSSFALTLNARNITSVTVKAATSDGSATSTFEIYPYTSIFVVKDSSVWIILGSVLGGILLIIVIIISVIYGKQTRA